MITVNLQNEIEKISKIITRIITKYLMLTKKGIQMVVSASLACRPILFIPTAKSICIKTNSIVFIISFLMKLVQHSKIILNVLIVHSRHNFDT